MPTTLCMLAIVHHFRKNRCCHTKFPMALVSSSHKNCLSKVDGGMPWQKTTTGRRNRASIDPAFAAYSFAVLCSLNVHLFLTCHNNGETAVNGYNPALSWFLSVSCLSLAKLISTYYDKPCRIRFDHYIDWFELDLLHVNITAAHVISVTRAHFAHYGVHDKFLSDKGPHYVTQEFLSFAEA